MFFTWPYIHLATTDYFLIGINLSTGWDVSRGKAAYIWISLEPAKAEPIQGGVVVQIISQSGLRLFC